MVTIGVVGGGQLARMMVPAAINLGVDIAVFAENDGSSASLATTATGDYRDFGQLTAFASSIEVLTFDHEHVPLEHLVRLRESGTTVYPPPEALALTQNKIHMRRRMDELDIPQPRWTTVTTASDFARAAVRVGGFPCIAKKPVGGYDGKGVRVINSPAECEDWLLEGELLLEELVSFARELAQLGARRPGGQWESWPVVETRQEGGVCSEVIAGKFNSESEVSIKAIEIAEKLAHGVGVVGVLAVELFETHDSRILVNELAMRPHNSGHVMTELSRTSQFEQHLRAISDLPLGSTELVAPFGVMANIFGGVSFEALFLAGESYPQAKIHNYRKSRRPGRKAGHVVVVGSDLDDALAHARGARRIMQGAG